MTASRVATVGVSAMILNPLTIMLALLGSMFVILGAYLLVDDPTV